MQTDICNINHWGKNDINSDTSLSEHIPILLATPNILQQDFLRCLINPCSGIYLIAVNT